MNNRTRHNDKRGLPAGTSIYRNYKESIEHLVCAPKGIKNRLTIQTLILQTWRMLMKSGNVSGYIL